MTQETQHADRARRMAQRGQALKGFAVIAGLLALAYGTWHWMANRHHEATDNAYVQAHIVPISAQVPGTVTRVGADDTGIVKSGQELVRLDPADADVALEQAKAQLLAENKDTGTTHVIDGDFDVTVEVSKDVSWDQKALQAIAAGDFTAEMTPVTVVDRFPDLAAGKVATRTRSTRPV